MFFSFTFSCYVNCEQRANYRTLAELLTVIELRALLSIWPRELVGMAWTQPELKRRGPEEGGAAHVCRVIDGFNRRIAWIAREVVSAGSLATHSIEYWIRLGTEALRRNNFSTVFQVVNALGKRTYTSSICRSGIRPAMSTGHRHRTGYHGTL